MATPGGQRTPVRVNLGSGSRCPEGWIHVDGSPGAWLGRHPRLFAFLRAVMKGPAARLLPAPGWGPNCRRMELTRRLGFGDASVDHVVASHVLEHLTRDEAAALLRDCARFVRPGGTLRVIVPDLEALVGGYALRRAEDPAGAAAWFVASTGFLEMPPPRRAWALPLWFVRRRHNHAFLYDEAALRAAFAAAGFVDVRRCAFGDSRIPGILEIELESRFENAVCLEGVRPA